MKMMMVMNSCRTKSNPIGWSIINNRRVMMMMIISFTSVVLPSFRSEDQEKN